MVGASFGRVLLGVILIMVGLCHIVFFRRVKELYDALNRRDPLLWWGDWWTGKYSRGGLIITYAVTIIIGLTFLGFGLAIVLNLLN